MIAHQIPTDNYDVTLNFKVTADKPMVLRVKGYDANSVHPNTVFFDRDFGMPGALVKGSFAVKAPMPLTPSKLNLIAFDKISGSQAGIRIEELKVSPLDKRLTIFNTPDDYEFFRFLELFVKAAGYNPVGTYFSKNKKFRIKYSDVIYNEEGKPLTTPARVMRANGFMEFSRPQFQKMTIPMRMFIGLHEYCHFRLNTRKENEADNYALQIYLGMGFPRSEAMYAFTKVFKPVNPVHEKALESRMEGMLSYMKQF